MSQDYCDILGFLREARSKVLEERRKCEGRELSICLTHIDTAILWRQEDMRLKTPSVNKEKGD